MPELFPRPRKALCPGRAGEELAGRDGQWQSRTPWAEPASSWHAQADFAAAQHLWLQGGQHRSNILENTFRKWLLKEIWRQSPNHMSILKQFVNGTTVFQNENNSLRLRASQERQWRPALGQRRLAAPFCGSEHHSAGAGRVPPSPR